MNEEQIRIAIAVLKAYTACELLLDDGILIELDTAIEEAFNSSLPSDPDDYPDDDPGFDPMFLMM